MTQSPDGILPKTEDDFVHRPVVLLGKDEVSGSKEQCNLQLALYRGDTALKEYQGSSQSQIAKDIAENFGVQVDGGALWRTMKRWTGSKSASGFSLRLVDGKLEKPSVTHSLLKTLSNARPAVLQHNDGRCFIVWSYQHRDATSLGYNAGNMGMHLRRKGYANGSGNWRGRFLTDSECANLIDLSPYYYEIQIDGAMVKGWNLSSLAKQWGFAESKGTPPPNVSRIIRNGAGSCRAYGHRISGRIVYTGAPMALSVTDELATALKRPTLD